MRHVSRPLTLSPCMLSRVGGTCRAVCLVSGERRSLHRQSLCESHWACRATAHVCARRSPQSILLIACAWLKEDKTFVSCGPPQSDSFMTVARRLQPHETGTCEVRSSEEVDRMVWRACRPDVFPAERKRGSEQRSDDTTYARA